MNLPSRNNLLTLLSILALTALTGCGKAPNANPEQRIARAEQYLDHSQLGEAVIELKNALQQAPDNARARWLLGRTYLRLHDGGGAEKELRRALDLGVTAESVHPLLARALSMQGRYEGILRLDTRQRLSPAVRARLLAIQGEALVALGRPDEAARKLKRAQELAPESPEVLTAQGRLAGARGDLDAARRMVERALKKDPNLAPAWALLATVERRSGHLQAAEQALGKALTADPWAMKDRLRRARLRIALGRNAEAEEDLRWLRKHLPGQADVEYTSGLLAFQEKHYEKALNHFENTLKQVQGYHPALFFAGAIRLFQNHLESANDYLQRFLSYRPDYLPARRMLAYIALRHGDYTQAERLIRPVVDKTPEDLFAVNLLADSLMRRKQTAEGITYLRQAVNLHPESGPAHLNLGLGLLFSGDEDAAIRQLKKARKLDPKLAAATQAEIEARLKKGDLDGALAAARAYRDAHPDQTAPLLLLARVQTARKASAEAARALRAVLRLAPGNPQANNGLADMALADGDLDQAEKRYRDTLSHHPDDYDTLMRLAAVQRRRNDAQGLRDALERALKVRPRAAEPLLRLARLDLAEGKPQQAFGRLSGARERLGDSAAFLTLIGEAELALGEYTQAKLDLQKVVRLLPDHAPAHFRLAKAYLGLRQKEGYWRELQRTLKLDPGHWRARLAVVDQLLGEARLDAAAKELEILRKQIPDRPGFLLRAGVLADLRHEPAKALAAYRQAFAKQPGSLNLLRLAKAEWRQGKRDQALGRLEAWVKQSPKDRLILSELANRYLELGRKDEAITIFRKELEIAPKDAMAHNNLAWLLRASDPKAALRHAEKAVELAPNSPDLLDTLAMVLFEQGDDTRALRMIERALKQRPGDATLMQHKARIQGGGDSQRKEDR